MKTGEKLFHFLAKLILDRFYGSVTIRFEHGKVTHVETETRRAWEYKNLPSPGAAVEAGNNVHEKLSMDKRRI